MNDIRNVAILGAGAMGAYFAHRFHITEGFDTRLIAGGERGERLRHDGLAVNGEAIQVPVAAPPHAGPPADLVVVALKHHHLESALADLKPFVGADTLILSVMNGLVSEEIFGATVVEMGARYGVPTPVNRTLLQIIRVLEGDA